MAGAACKVVINQGLIALSNSLETILTNPDLSGGLIPESARREMLQNMADLDIATYTGSKSRAATNLQEIMKRLEEVGVLSADVWKIYAAPGG